MAAANQRISWIVTETAWVEIADVRSRLGPDGYDEEVEALREYLVGYFDAVPGCSGKQGKSISPVGATKRGGKILKTRWKYPGAGKSGGLRLCFVAFCEKRKVVLCHAAIRRDVDDDELIDSAHDAEAYIDENDESG